MGDEKKEVSEVKETTETTAWYYSAPYRLGKLRRFHSRRQPGYKLRNEQQPLQ